MKNIFIKSALVLTAIFTLSGCNITQTPYEQSGSSNDTSYDINIVDKSDVTTPQSTEAVAKTVAPSEIEVTEAIVEATEAVVEVTEAPVTEEIPEITEAPTDAYDDYSDDTYVEYYFRTEKQLDQHFAKHGGEFENDFGYESAEEYEIGASDVINNPDALYKTEAEDGDGVYYIEDTNEFVVLSKDGYIRTYFRPNAGIDYFNRQ